MKVFFLTPPPPQPLWKFQLSFTHFFQFFGPSESPTPQEIPIPSVGRVWIFSGTAHYVSIISSIARALNIHVVPA